MKNLKSVRLSSAMYLRGPLWIIPAVAAVVIMLFPVLGANSGVLRIVVSTALLSMLVVGLNISFGFAGEFALGQSAIYGFGAYFAGYFAVHGLDIPITLVIGVLAAAAVGLLTGFPGTRLGAWALGMITFFLVLMFPKLVILLPAQTGGSIGLTGIPLPSVFGIQLSNNGYYLLVVGIAIFFFVLLRNYVKGRHGSH